MTTDWLELAADLTRAHAWKLMGQPEPQAVANVAAVSASDESPSGCPVSVLHLVKEKAP